MSGKTNIQWATDQWNPIVGCSVVSPGCTNCYAMRMAGTWLRGTEPYKGLTQDSKAGPVWNGKVRLLEERLGDPLRWRAPKDGSRRRVFVNSMGDLFHEAVPEGWISRVFTVMALAPQHDFLVLTKRAERMREYIPRAGHPIPNVWLGVSAEDQTRADERIPLLLDTPAAVRFVSAEPLLGKLDLFRPGLSLGNHGVNWVIVGGESGPGARPFDLAWARSIVAQCRSAGVPCFIKQLGSLVFENRCEIRFSDRKGGDPSEWPEDLRVREYPRRGASREARGRAL